MKWSQWEKRQLVQLFVDVFVITTAVGCGIGWLIIIIQTAIRFAP